MQEPVSSSSPSPNTTSSTTGYSVNRPMTIPLNPVYRHICFVSLLALLVLCVAWELYLDPIGPRSRILALKALPLVFPLYGVYKGNLYTMQWSSMLVLLYVMEGVVRWYTDLSPVSRYLGMGETLLSMIVFISAIMYVRPAKKVAKAVKKQGK